MARMKRAAGKRGVYHVLLRSRGSLFLDEKDYQAFLRTLGEYFDGYRNIALGYALLQNRAHLIVECGAQPLGQVMKPFCTSYARYFNRIHNLSGKLFYDRYKSVPLETGEALADALAFVHAVPARAGLLDWPYTSLAAYTAGAGGICRQDRAEALAGGRRALLAGDSCRMGIEDYIHMSDPEIESYFQALCGYGFAEWKKLPPAEQKEAIEKVRAQKWVKMPRLSALLETEIGPARKRRAPQAEPRQEIPEKEELSVWLL